jgi:hypothetical protein
MDLISKKDSQRVEELPEEPIVQAQEKPQVQEEPPAKRITFDEGEKVMEGNGRKAAVDKMINYLNIANRKGCFELGVSKQIYNAILATRSEKSTQDELKIAIFTIVEALKLANKGGAFEIQESADIYDACSIFVKEE